MSSLIRLRAAKTAAPLYTHRPSWPCAFSDALGEVTSVSISADCGASRRLSTTFPAWSAAKCSTAPQRGYCTTAASRKTSSAAGGAAFRQSTPQHHWHCLLRRKIKAVTGRLTNKTGDIKLRLLRLTCVDSSEPRLNIFVPTRITELRVRPKVVCPVCHKLPSNRSLIRTNQTPSNN